MNKLIKKIALFSLTVVALLNISACTSEPLGVIDADLPPYESPYTTPFGSAPDCEGLKVDGATDDEIWQGEWQTYAISTTKGEINCYAKGIITNKGLAIAFRSDDSTVIWQMKGNKEKNTYASITIRGDLLGEKKRTFVFDANGLYPASQMTNLRTSYEGDITEGVVSAFRSDAFVAWSEMGFTESPDEITVDLQYFYKATKISQTEAFFWSIKISK